jgi:hypothetical protein
MANTFSNPRDPEGIIIREKITEWLLFYEERYSQSVILIEDVPCIDVGCPDRETLINIEGKDVVEKIRIRKPLVFIRKWDIEFALHQKRNSTQA